MVWRSVYGTVEPHKRRVAYQSRRRDMANWLIREDAPSVTIVRGKEVGIRARRRPRIGEGDQLYFLTSLHGEIHARATVTSSAQEVSETNAARASASAPIIPVVFAIATSGVEELPQPLEIDALRYSLTIVRKLENPEAHFRRGYRSLPKEDVDTITSGEAYISRTAFYELYFAIPRSLRAKFDFHEEMLQPSSRDTKARLRRLNSFLEDTVYAAGDMLEDLSRSIASLELGFSHQFDGAQIEKGLDLPSDSVEVQTARFRELREALRRSPARGNEPTNLVDDILSEISEGPLRESEIRFQRRFRGRA